MAWNIFWSAFGAIGTTLGSVVTAFAVVIAVIQYRQPLRKKLKITVATGLPVINNELRENVYCVTISNTGIRPVLITNVYFRVGKRNVMISGLASNIASGNAGNDFPKTIEPEHYVSIYLSYKLVATRFTDLLAERIIDECWKVKVLVTDTTNGDYFYNLHMSAKQMLIALK